MSREARRSFRISQLTVEQINFTFGLLADRLDELEGRRGTPQFKADVNMGTNKIGNLGDASASDDALSYGQGTTYATGAAAAAATAAVSPIQATIEDANNWITYRKVVDTNGTITHGFNVTSI